MTAYAVVTALHDVFVGVWPDRQTFYGPPASSEWTGEAPSTWVAHSETDAAAVEVVAEGGQEDGSQDLTVLVQCAAAVYSGGEDVQVAFLELEQHVQALRAAVLADRTLGGIAQGSEFAIRQGYEFSREQGVRILCLFSVEVNTWSS